ncbi:putative methyltransferase DDB_G0268948 [Saccostrea echinata]|uniref:putative methyltransferase DDB_G0268948 n=1 Tax=Saccostrea echinata TaxID=191078 RepID=UPI002A7FC374|nr:putative methyltransferase DDB_G0268948 [Saccostrea echinata]
MELFVGSEHSDMYHKFRPTYPPEMYEFISEYSKSGTGTLDTAVDVGCGTGISTIPLCKYFQKVTGVDVSETQIKTARMVHKQSNVSFFISRAEQMEFLSDCSVDLVTVAQTMHWLEMEPFYKEVIRILKPRGSIVIYGYGNGTLNKSEGNLVIEKFFNHDLEEFWDSRSRHADNFYQNMYLPFSGWERKSDFFIQNKWSANEVVGYLSTWSSCRKYLKKNPKSGRLDEIQQQLIDIYNGQKITITWPMVVFVGRKNTQAEENINNVF